MSAPKDMHAEPAAARPSKVVGAMRELRSAFIDVTLHAQKGFAVCDYIEHLEAKLEAVGAGGVGAMVSKPDIATAIHYPAHWDTAAYPTLESALSELSAWFKCSECAQPSPAAVERKPLTLGQIGDAVRAAHIAFCLDKFPTFEHAIVHFTEQAHGIAAQQGDKT